MDVHPPKPPKKAILIEVANQSTKCQSGRHLELSHARTRELKSTQNWHSLGTGQPPQQKKESTIKEKRTSRATEVSFCSPFEPPPFGGTSWKLLGQREPEDPASLPSRRSPTSALPLMTPFSIVSSWRRFTGAE